MPSLLFAGNVNSYFTVLNNPELVLGTDDFTIEWYQYETDGNRWPRIFQIGGSASQVDIGLSNEGTLYFWNNNGATSLNYNTNDNPIKNVWRHFAIVSLSGTISFYIDGIFVPFDGGALTGQNFASTADLRIGNETVPDSVNGTNTSFGGNIMYFHWIQGTAKYTSNFTVPTTFPAVLPNTKFIITAYGNYATSNTTATNIVNTNVGIADPNIPPGFTDVNPNYVIPSPPPPPPPTPSGSIRDNYKSFFTNNSQVYYKPGSMGSTSGVGGVGNYRRKAKFT